MNPEIVKEENVQDLPAGVADGTVIETPADEPNEVVVYETDADGNVIGWHKEPVNG